MSTSSSAPQSRRPSCDAIAEQASLWLARRDRGLSPAEQDAYMQWLAADPRHTEAMMQQAAALERMMHLYEWQPVHHDRGESGFVRTVPSCDRLAAGSRCSARGGRGVRLDSGPLVACAGVAGEIPPARKPAPGVARWIAGRTERRQQVACAVFRPGAARELTGGEAQFSVWKDPARPFIVEAAGVEVRAVGTVFNVRLEDRAVAVLVTEGRVKVNREPSGAGPATASADVIVAAGEQTAVPLAFAAGPVAPVVAPATSDEISQSRAWQTPRLQFFETPLAEAVAEFNRLNRFQIVIGDAELGARPIGGTFRPDNVEGFVRLLETTLDVRAERRGEHETVLRRRREGPR